jgi:hypothetical protein
MKRALLFALVLHHAFGSMYDSNRVVRAKGVIMLFANVNPHSLIFVDSTDANGVEHWALESLNMQQMRSIQNAIKPGGVIEFCGYATKDGVPATKSYQSPEPISLSLKSIPRPIWTGNLISPEIITLANGEKIGRATNSKCL